MSSTRRIADRSSLDNYYTPSWCVERLLDAVELPDGLWLEPSAGIGNICQEINAQYKGAVFWTAVEIREECQGPLEQSICDECSDVIIDDFLKVSFPNGQRKFNVAISNPPYSLALPIIQRCLGLAEWVVMLLRLNFLGSIERQWFFKSLMPDVHVLPNRPSFIFDDSAIVRSSQTSLFLDDNDDRNIKKGKGTDSTEYAWFVWPPNSLRSQGIISVLGLTEIHERHERQR